MSFFNVSRKHKIVIEIILISIVILILTLNVINYYLENLTPKINDVVKSKLEKITYEIITDEINTNVITENNLANVLKITKNSEGEILAVDYNLEYAYKVNNLINNSITKSLTNLDVGKFENSEFKLAENSIYLEVPLFISSDYIILSSLGPKIPIKIDFIGTLVTNLKTKITSYGLNNVLSELYISVEIKELITTPVTREEITIKYDILIDATLINGRVPTFYGGEIVTESPILDIPIN